MLRKNKILFWGFVALTALMISSACSIFSKAIDTAEKGKNAAETIQAVATNADDIIGQAEKMATEVGSSGMMQTAQVMMTQAVEGGMMETLQAVVTNVPGEVGDLRATAQAGIENFQASTPPDDIPLVPGELEGLITSNQLINYTTSMDFQEVVDFYKEEMPANDWKSEDKSVESGTNNILFFTKSDRQAMITIIGDPQNHQTQVTITIISD